MKTRVHRLATAVLASGTATAAGLNAFTAPAFAADPESTGGVGILACTSIPSTADPAVLKIVYEVGLSLNVSDKVMLAGFEAGWVESHMNNLPCGDRDSLGVFQQRPSQGWGSPEQIMNVHYAATQFFTRAIPVAANNPGYTAGQVAQAVQISAFPARYDQEEATARALIEQARQLVGTPPRPIGKDTVGYFHRGSAGGEWHLTNDNAGASDAAFPWGPSQNVVPLVGDWNGDGKDTIGFFRPTSAGGEWHLTNDNNGQSDAAFVWGRGDGVVPVVGDWNNDGKDTIGFYVPATGEWHLTNDNNGQSDAAFVWGPADVVPVTGDWNNDGKDTIGYYVPSRGEWHLTDDNEGQSDAIFQWGPTSGVTPITGDWNADGKDTVGFYGRSAGAWHLTNDNAGPSDASFEWGPGGNVIPITGDWNGA